MFYILTSDIEERSALIAHLGQAGILAVFHYVPLHSSPYGQSLGGRSGALPITEEMSARVLRLPLYYDMSEADVASVGEAIFDFYHV
jgi:dTDP-4-amino-4,6-dideoxygalactose transaminase